MTSVSPFFTSISTFLLFDELVKIFYVFIRIHRVKLIQMITLCKLFWKFIRSREPAWSLS